MTKISIITTIKHNVGDDFVREGIIYLLDQILENPSYELIHKHSPITAYYGTENIRDIKKSRLIEPFLRSIRVKNRITNSDVLVQSGAPIYWCHDDMKCEKNEWYDTLVNKIYKNSQSCYKFLNIAGGSCQKFHSDGTEISGKLDTIKYIREFYDVCDLTLLRDELAQKMCQIAGRNADVLPCTSIFARDKFKITPQKGEYIVVNYMKKGGHFDLGQSINIEKWKNNFKYLVEELSKVDRVVAACHTSYEKKIISELIPGIESFIIPNDHVSFINFYSRAKFGVVNRVHSGFMMASLGKPVHVIGSDSRAQMVKNLNLKTTFVNDLTPDIINNIIDDVVSIRNTYQDEIDHIRKKSEATYIEKISQAFFC